MDWNRVTLSITMTKKSQRQMCTHQKTGQTIEQCEAGQDDTLFLVEIGLN